jgi:hypothetical protein
MNTIQEAETNEVMALAEKITQAIPEGTRSGLVFNALIHTIADQVFQQARDPSGVITTSKLLAGMLTGNIEKMLAHGYGGKAQ